MICSGLCRLRCPIESLLAQTGSLDSHKDWIKLRGAGHDQCCGFGGTFAVKYPAISGAIVEDKAACIRATGAEVTVCNEAGCTMNIAGMLHRQGVPSQVRHIAELIAEAMGLDYQQW